MHERPNFCCTTAAIDAFAALLCESIKPWHGVSRPSEGIPCRGLGPPANEAAVNSEFVLLAPLLEDEFIRLSVNEKPP